ncbi:hypothetical protein O2W18_21085 [Modestobacter sp. VKM Ac-2983]|uniref:hypothetical protein n=1 Tax=Modestobacter sp. VKM Ac-2983 TaxID=3004137 RepID=UPI0022ABB6C0|nr:hypothetical protein [Modestobacter sp. VKM Ac-2983]MCZ2807608.1 hypothetical protein [Modestobacter sp. VKM Ac-2983]
MPCLQLASAVFGAALLVAHAALVLTLTTIFFVAVLTTAPEDGANIGAETGSAQLAHAVQVGDLCDWRRLPSRDADFTAFRNGV